MVGVSLAGLYFIYWGVQFPTRRVSLLANDWDEAYFRTSSDASVPAAYYTLASNAAGGGAMDGQTQFMRSWAANFLSSPPYVTSISEFSAENVIVTVLDTEEFDLVLRQRLKFD